MLKPFRLWRLARCLLRALWVVARFVVAQVCKLPRGGTTSSAARSVRRRGDW